MNQAASPAIAALRSATAPLHALLEQSIHIARPGAGRSQYAAYVGALWGWLAPIEQSMWSAAWPEGAHAADRAVKSGWLAEDIQAARADGFLAGEIATRAPQPFDSLASRAGWAYVVEGSMLGAEVLERRLGPALRPWPAHWLHGYGDAGAARWREFLAVLGESVTSARDVELCARGGAQAFESIGEWMRARGAA